ncbi:hypothetical protein [Brevibacillus daliensis]|nr:hypothetical protein [Brevibacillus daliensis]
MLAETLGYSVISDDQINAIANGVAACAAVLAATLNNFKNKTE